MEFTAYNFSSLVEALCYRVFWKVYGSETYTTPTPGMSHICETFQAKSKEMSHFPLVFPNSQYACAKIQRRFAGWPE